jgi:hypothetical protein
MGKSNWAKGRLTRKPAVKLPSCRPADRPIVRSRQLHDEIVRMLLIVEGSSITSLAGRQQIGITATVDRPWLDAEHPATCETSGAERALRHAHHPIDAAELIPSTIAAVIEVLDEQIAVAHQDPT